MTLTLDATPAGTGANTYCTLAEANTYHETRIHVTSWTAATDATKGAALTMATRLLDATYEWDGVPTYPETQALLWPRVGMWHRNAGKYVEQDEIPQELKEATAEFARQLIDSDRTAQGDAEDEGIASLKAGSIALEFREGARKSVVPSAVISLLPSSWGRVRGRTLSACLVRT